MKNRKLLNGILSVILVLSLVFSQFILVPSVLEASAEENIEDEEIVFWDGTVASEFASGDGSKYFPFEIETPQQLYKMVVEYDSHEDSKGVYFKITKDIYLNKVADGTSIVNVPNKWNWFYDYGGSSLSTASKATAFAGSLDGDGHTIYGLYVTAKKNSPLGLFPAIATTAVIKNLSFDNLLITGDGGYGGAIAGSAYWNTTASPALITNCSVTNATIGQDLNLQFAAGFIGNTLDCTITFANCYSRDLSLSNWAGSGTPGGILGNAYSSGTLRINNCYTVGYFPTNSNLNKAICTNVYTDIAIPEDNTTEGVTVLNTAQMQGEAAKTNLAGFDFKWTWKTAQNGYPIIDAIEVWDGESATSFNGFNGSGSEEDPYQIENGSQLAYIVSNDLDDGKYYKLVKDIRLNDTTSASWKDNAHNWVWANVRFVGNFDGDGHTIDGFYFNGSQQRYGLFSYVGDSIIANFKMTNAYINNTKSGNDSVGAAFVAGQTSAAGTFEKIYIDESCVLNAPNMTGVAGILGRCNANSTVKNCAVLANITGSGTVGAILGKRDNGTLTITSSFTSANYPLNGSGSLTNSVNNYGLVADSYGTTVLTVEQMKDEAAKDNMTGLSFRFVWETVENGYPILNPRGELWDGTVAASFDEFKGSGSEEDPYQIENGAQLAFAAVKNSTLNGGHHFKLVNDIVLNDTQVDNWKSLARNWLQNTKVRFVGTFDGDGHTIEGLYFSTTSARLGLFAYVGDSLIKNINFTGASINNTSTDSTEGIAIVAGQTSATTTFEGINIDETCEINAPYSTGVGAIVARGYENGYKAGAIIKNCAVHATIVGKSAVGVFTGTYWAADAFININNSFTSTNLPLNGNWKLTNSANNYGTLEDAYGTTVLTTNEMKGEDAVTNMTGLHFGRHWKVVENGYPVPVVYNAPKDVWDGTVATSFEGFDGSGTEEDPYQIENGSQLAYVVSKDLTDGLYYKLVKDIKLNDTSDAQWTKSARNWVWADVRFVGNFDGDGHTIDGLYFNGSQKRFGLFAYTGDSLIKNIKFSNAYINNTTSDEGVGIVIGQTSADTEFQKIYIDETCEINAPNASCVAAISPRGYTYTDGVANVTISDSAVLATINGGSYTGALVGSYWYSDAVVKINGCFTASNVALTGGNRSLTESSNNYALVIDSYDTTVLTAEQMKGEAARENMTGLVFGAVWETVKNGYPVITENPIESWDGTKATTFAGGSGTADDPWLIENGAQLYKMAADYNTMNVFRGPEDQVDANGNIVAQPHFKITKDINLGNLKWYVNSIYSGSLTNTNFTKGFNGVIYGDGHTIYGLSISGSDKYSTGGLISVATQGAQIYDLHLDNGRIDQDYWNARGFAAFIGLAVGSSSSHPIIIDRCSVDNFNINSRFGSAAFVGYVYSQSVSINNSYCVNSSLSVTATDNTQNAGAFIAVANGNAEGNIITIENCYTDDVPLAVKYLDASMGTITTFNNVYTSNENMDVTGVNTVTKSELIGSAAKETLKGFNFNQVWSCGDDGEYPVHLPYEEVEYWNGREAYSYAGGDGSAEKPYEIATASQLYKLANADTASTKGKYYKLTADIAISRNYEGWQNDNPYTWAKKTAYLTGYTYGNSFAGTFDGAGHTVSGLYISEEVANGATYAYGLIPFVSANAVVKNVNIDDVKIDIDGNAYVGAIVGAAYTAESDAASPLNTAQIVAANVTKSDITSTNADTTGDIYGGAVGGVKVELCNTNELVGDILTYNYANVDETALTNISSYLLGTSDAYITDINAVEYFDIRDLVCAYEAILAKKTPVDTDSYNLVWSQEFNGTELDYSVWSRNTNMSRGSTIKYTDINSLSNGSLTLSCAETNESDENGNKIYNVNYGLDTLDTMSFKYGKLEMRAKIPFYAGAFPSLWLTSRGALGNSKITPYSTEIDIFEVFGNGAYDIEIEDLGSSTLNQNQMVACVHKWYNDANGNQLKVDKNNIECSCGTSSDAGNNYVVKESDRSKTFETSNQKEAFHTIVFEWTEDEMIFKVDDTEYYTINREDVEELGFGLSEYEDSEEAVHDLTGIFEQFLCVRLNNHMYTPGGAYEFTTSYGQKINTDDLDYEIDYVRLYQKNDGKSQINLK